VCVIVDNDVVSRVLLHSDDSDYRVMHRALFGRRRPYARIVYGGKLAREYAKSEKIRRAIAVLDRAARARVVSDDAIAHQAQWAEASGFVRSNDAHVIGLARASGARILCSEDALLRDDFRDRRLVPAPRGRIFSNDGHAHMIRADCADVVDT
jgi:hypothetical protein